jgi:chorismate synthase
MVVRNKDQRPQDYQDMAVAFRPSHADATYQAKYGIQARSGGGRASARDTIGRVAAGAIAKQLLAKSKGTEVLAWVQRIHTIEAQIDPLVVCLEDVERTMVRCPDGAAADKMVERIEAIGREGDSCGGVITCVVRRPPTGLGMPVFDKLEADLAKAVMSLPATKGFEIGSGFGGTLLKGSEHNDAFLPSEGGQLRTATNNSGGIQGGISNGENILIRVAFKPTATIRKPQQTINAQGEATLLEAKGRHDPCVLPRAVPMVEAMVALVLADHLLRQQGQCSLW